MHKNICLGLPARLFTRMVRTTSQHKIVLSISKDQVEFRCQSRLESKSVPFDCIQLKFT